MAGLLKYLRDLFKKASASKKPPQAQGSAKLDGASVGPKNALSGGRTEEVFRLLVDAVVDYAIFALDVRGHILTWNKGAERLKFYRADEIIEQHFSKFYPQPDIDQGKPQREIEAATERGSFEDEGWRLRKDGSRFWANVVITAMRDVHGTLIGFSKVTRDLSERKLAEEALRDLNANLEKEVLARTTELMRSNARLEVAVKARDEFLSIASHELKTPLTSLKLQAQMRERAISRQNYSLFAVDKLNRMVQDDARQINRLTRLVDDMLDIARISSGKFTLQSLVDVDLGALAQEVVERFSPQLEAAGCSVSIDRTSTAVGQWDVFRIEQVLVNLLTNAMKYGAGKPIHIAIEGHAGQAKLTISDCGIGISESDRERVFGQFERAISADDISGLGLGLYIVRQIVEAHRGKIWVESELGKGSTFIVELPTVHMHAKASSSGPDFEGRLVPIVRRSQVEG